MGKKEFVGKRKECLCVDLKKINKKIIVICIHKCLDHCSVVLCGFNEIFEDCFLEVSLIIHFSDLFCVLDNLVYLCNCKHFPFSPCCRTTGIKNSLHIFFIKLHKKALV